MAVASRRVNPERNEVSLLGLITVSCSKMEVCEHRGLLELPDHLLVGRILALLPLAER